MNLPESEDRSFGCLTGSLGSSAGLSRLCVLSVGLQPTYRRPRWITSLSLGAFGDLVGAGAGAADVAGAGASAGAGAAGAVPVTIVVEPGSAPGSGPTPPRERLSSGRVGRGTLARRRARRSDD